MKTLKSMILIVVIALCAPVAAYSDQAGSGSAGIDFMRNYVWRGQKLSNAAVIQPSAGINYKGFGASLWANYDTGINEHNETDLTLNYAFSVDRLSFEAGYIYYALEGADDTQEIYLTAWYDVMLSPSLTIYYDFDEGDGAFIVAALSYTVPLQNRMGINLGASAGYNAGDLVMGTDAEGDEFSGFYNAELSASLSIPIKTALSIKPKIAYSFPLSSDAKDAIRAISDDSDSDVLYGGINISLSF